MQTLSEKRVFGEKFETTAVFVGTELGLVAVTVSADQIGEFGLSYRGRVSDVATSAEAVAIATDDGVLTAPIDDSASPSFDLIDPDPAVAIDYGADGLLVGTPDGAVRRLDSDGSVSPLCDTAGVRSIDAPLVAAADGVYRVVDGRAATVGLTDVRDVLGSGTPLAATANGLYTLANGWTEALPGPFSRVAGDGHGRAHAVGDRGLFERSAGEWTERSFPVDESVIELAHGSGIVAVVTDAGRLGIDAGDGWRHQLLGFGGVSGVAIAPTSAGT
ncbi:MAG: HVO_0234 family beta-propeller protein [Halobacteriota archaeon]